MKSILRIQILSGALLLFSMIFMGSCVSEKNRNVPGSVLPYRLTYMVMISNKTEEVQATALIESIREFGGELAHEPVIAVLSNSQDSLGISIEKKADRVVKLEMDENLRNFPFSDKVFACAQVEELVENETEWLLWLNPDAIIFEEPKEILADDEKWVSIRPVHHKNVGSDFSGPINEYWKRIYARTGVDSASLWPVESLVDNQQVRPYYNSGCMAFRPSRELLRSWKNAYCSMLGDQEQLAFYSSDSNWAIFFHQALLSAVIASYAGCDRINVLPPSYSYPLVLQKVEFFSNRIDSIPGITIMLAGDYGNLGTLKIDEPFNSWITRNIRPLQH